jgi:hypothetical protein
VTKGGSSVTSAEVSGSTARPSPAPLRIPTVVVIGGAAIGARSAVQLLRAIDAGRLDARHVLVVDRDPACAAARLTDPRLRVDVADWDDWLDRRLGSLGADDHLVPYHWAPHLLLTWLERQLVRRGHRTVRGGDVAARGLPYESRTSSGDRALSYADWVCPPTCIEPALCPHTRGPRDWSLARDLEESPGAFDGRVVFRCLHLVYGVGTTPVRDLWAARDDVVRGTAAAARTYLVATSSHCHALATPLLVFPPGE